METIYKAMTKQPKLKPVKAWAIVYKFLKERFKELSLFHGMWFDIFPTRKQATQALLDAANRQFKTIVPVLITPIKPKKK